VIRGQFKPHPVLTRRMRLLALAAKWKLLILLDLYSIADPFYILW